MVTPVPSPCPQCGTTARVRAVPAEYAAGVSVTETNMRFSVNGGRYRGRSRSRSIRHTVLARDLAPPRALPSPAVVSAAAGVLAGLTVVLVVAATMTGGSGDGGWFLATLTAASAVLCAMTAARRRRRIQRDGVLTAAARRLWQNTLYCNGCNSVFLPAGRPVPAPRLRAALRTTAAKRLASTSAA